MHLTKIMLSDGSKTLSAAEWCSVLGFPRRKLARRIARYGADADFSVLFYEGSFENRKDITYNGETMNIAEWARRFGIGENVVRTRLKRGWTMAQIESGHGPDSKTVHYITRDGVTDTERGWCKRNGVPYSLARMRLRIGWSREEAFGFKPHKKHSAKEFTWRNETHTLSGWARKIGISSESFSKRVKRYREGSLSAEDLFKKGETPRTIPSKMKRWNGRLYTVQELADKAGINKTSFYRRLNEGWSISKIMTTPASTNGTEKHHEINGKSMLTSEVAAMLGISKQTLLARMRSTTMTVEEMLTPGRISPVDSQRKAVDARKMNTRKRDLMRMGIIV